ncbi:MAG: helix-turn-helix domain-containing protein [Anaerolineae bacterium]
MQFVFDMRASESPLVEQVWYTRSVGGGSFMSSAGTNMELVFTRQVGKTTVTMRGPETQARPAPVPEDVEFMGIIFKLGTYIHPFPTYALLNGSINLPDACRQSFWLYGAVWEIPNFENVDTFVARLTRQELLVRDDIVASVLEDQPHDLSIRSVRRHFLRSTGLTLSTIRKIERARQAAELLRQGKSILDTVFELGYFDQPHLTRALKYLIGQTPAQLISQNKSD